MMHFICVSGPDIFQALSQGYAPRAKIVFPAEILAGGAPLQYFARCTSK